MNFSLTSLVLDSAELESESAFWHRLLGGSLTRTPSHHFLRVDGLPVLVVQHAPDHVPPRWPDGASQQVHFDLTTDDIAAADQRVLEGGGRRLRPDDGPVDPAVQGSRVYGSPAGHPFCLRPGPTGHLG